MRIAGALLAVMLLAGCADPAKPAAVPPPVPHPYPLPSLWSPSPVIGEATTSPPTPRRSSSAPVERLSAGWEITVYYTAVEEFHDGDDQQVTGCPKLACSNGDADLGTYPSGFVETVEAEGTGRTSDGTYLNWSYDTGFWLDTAPRDTDGNPLRPFSSAAADPGVLPKRTAFRVTDCGRQDDGSRPAARVCSALTDATWRVTDEFTPGLGGDRHLDVYIGEETGPDFTRSDFYVSLSGAVLRIG